MPEPNSKPVVKRPRSKQLVFYERYAEHHNATLAAIEARYSRKNAHNTGSRLARDVELQKRINAYGQLGLDTLAVIASTSTNHIAAEKAAEALVDRAYGKAKSNDVTDKKPSIVISFNKIDSTGKVIEGTALTPEITSGGDTPGTASR